MQHFELSQLVDRIRRSVAVNFPEPVWVEAELAQCKQSRGHWYLDLIQKDLGNGDTRAQINAVIWKTTAGALERKGAYALEELLQEGRQLLMEVSVDFHPVYGLKLLVHQIDTAFTEGQLAKERAATIAALIGSGLWDRNRSLGLPRVIQRIALISNRSAAGYADFIRHTRDNNYGFKFHMTLFESALQGQGVITEIPQQLALIAEESDRFDAIVIIRGGGSKMDLSAFDHLQVAKAIATAPLPVITGIGHEIDETVSDLVSSVKMKTPTATAAFLIDRMHAYELAVEELFRSIQESIIRTFSWHDEQIVRLMERIRSMMTHRIDHARSRIDEKWGQLLNYAKWSVKHQFQSLGTLEYAIEAADPEKTLQRGFSMLMHDGKLVKDPGKLEPGAILINKAANGSVTSQFQKYEPKEK